MMSSIPRLNERTINLEGNHLKNLQSKIHTQIKNILFEKGWLLFLVGFLLGRAIILSAVSPFPVAFLATIWFIHKKKSFKVILAIIAGALTFSVIHTVFVVL